MLGVNTDAHNTEYVTFIEAKNYPIYGTMVHYEKSLFQWTTAWYATDHRLEAIELSQSFSNFFAQECCKNNHKFESKEEEWKHLVENYKPKFVAPQGMIVDTLYTF